MKIYILGGGPAGLAVVDGLVDRGQKDFVLIERAETLGGLAKTLEWKGVGFHDLGPHKIFSLDQNLVTRIESLLPEQDWLTKAKVSKIYMNGHYLNYPPSPFSLARVFGIPAFLKMLVGFGLAKFNLRHRFQKPRTFEQDLVSRLGKPLYEILFKPMSEKLWGNPKNLDVKLSQGRIQTPKVTEVLARLFSKSKKSDFEALTFRYPKGGLVRLWEAIQKKSHSHGEFCLGHTVSQIQIEGNSVRRIVTESALGTREFRLNDEDQVVSTLPISNTLQLMHDQTGAMEANRIVHLNDLFLVFLHVPQSSLMEESWIFVPDSQILFHRISEQESFDPSMTPNGSIVCCEIMSSASRNLSQLTDQELVHRTITDLKKMGFENVQILDSKVIRLPKSYPVYIEGFEPALNSILGKLDTIQNFKTVGRQGAFNYIGTLDAMDIGYGYSRWLTDSSQKRDAWIQERQRTQHYPVLD